MSLNKGGEYVPEIKSKNTRCTWEKLIRLRRGDITYIKYEYDRYYNPEEKIYLSTESNYRQGVCG